MSGPTRAPATELSRPADFAPPVGPDAPKEKVPPGLSREAGG